MGYHDGTKPSEFKVMSDEDREFLEKAMEDAFGKIEDPNEVMAEAIKMIKAPDRTEESITTALEVLDRSCDDRDCARNAEKLDGIQPLLDLLKTHSGPILNRTLEILALLFSNNQNIQEAGSRRGALDIFVPLVQSSPLGSEERSKAFRALVALVRNMQSFEEKLLKERDGVSLIVLCANLGEDKRLREKAASFARSLAQESRLGTEDVARLSLAFASLVGQASGEGIQYRETLSSCVAELARAAPKACVLALVDAVESRLKQLKSSSAPDESTEKESLTECLQLLKKS